MAQRYHQPRTSENKHSELRTGSPTQFDLACVQIFLEFVMRVHRRARRVPFMLTLMILTSFFHAGQSVWSLSIPHQVYIVGTVSQFCNGMGLTPKQSIICEEERALMPSIRYGANLAVQQCQYQFQYRQWNCSVPERELNTLFRRITGKGTREAAFTYAISSAGVVHSVARACVEGNLSVCGCSRERRPKDLKSEFQWGGCGDNIEFGAKKAKKFMNAGEDKDVKDTREQEKTLMNLHNNELGIQVVRERRVTRCKCHGVSESCEMKTCWKELAMFPVIGKILLKKYDSAVKVRYDRRTGRILKAAKTTVDGYKWSGKRRNTADRSPDGNLVYLDPSPNYCVKNNRREILGTSGRECKADIKGPGSCKDLCCKRGFLQNKVEIKERCQCKFEWCCRVKCKQCINEKTKYTCL